MGATWKPKSNCPATVEELRKALTVLAKKKTGKALIDPKFTKDHIFAGHAGSVLDLAKMLARFRDLPQSTLMTTSMDASAQKEVLNWILHVPANKFSLSNGTWTVSTTGTAVPAVGAYKFATVDLKAFKAMNADDVVKKSRNWLTESLKKPQVACMFDTDGTPRIYHLNY